MGAIATIIKVLIVAANAVTFGLGIWWNSMGMAAATALVILSAGKAMFIVASFVLPKGTFRSIAYLIVMGVAIVEIILLQNGSILIDFDLSFGNDFLDWVVGGAFEWVKNLLERVPLGVASFTATAAFVLLAMSVLIDQFLSGATNFSIASSADSDLPLLVMRPAGFSPSKNSKASNVHANADV